MKLGIKAQISLVVALSAFLTSTVVIVGFFGVVLPALQDATDKELCKISVQAKYAPTAISGKETMINLQCYTQTLEMKPEGIYKSGKKREPELIDNTYSENDYLVGTLVMDVFDEKSGDQIWQGIATKTITENPEKREIYVLLKEYILNAL